MDNLQNNSIQPTSWIEHFSCLFFFKFSTPFPLWSCSPQSPTNSVNSRSIMACFNFWIFSDICWQSLYWLYYCLIYISLVHVFGLTCTVKIPFCSSISSLFTFIPPSLQLLSLSFFSFPPFHFCAMLLKTCFKVLYQWQTLGLFVPPRRYCSCWVFSSFISDLQVQYFAFNIQFAQQYHLQNQIIQQKLIESCKKHEHIHSFCRCCTAYWVFLRFSFL